MQKKLHQAGTVNIVNLDEILYIKYRTHEFRNYFCLMNSNLPSLLSLLSPVQLAVVCLVECLCGPVDDSWLSTVRGAEKSVRISGLAWIGLTTCVVHWQDRRQCVCELQVTLVLQRNTVSLLRLIPVHFFTARISWENSPEVSTGYKYPK
jgi:hypothetical protein